MRPPSYYKTFSVPIFATDKLSPKENRQKVTSYPNGDFVYPRELENGLTVSTRSRQSCCSDHDPPPHWFAEVPPLVLHLLGTFLALLAGLFLTVGGLIISKVQTIKPLEISGLRSLLACVYLIPLLIYFRPKHDFGAVVLAETFGVSAIFCVKFVTFSVGSTLLPLSEFSLLCNTVPVFTAFFGCVFLSEKCGIREWLSCLVVTLGVVTTFVPSFIANDSQGAASGDATQSTSGYIITMMSALSNAIALCWLRRLKEVHSLLITFYACIVTGFVSMAGSFILNQYVAPTDTNDLLLIAGAAFCMLTQALLPAIACTLTQASRVAVAMTFSVVFSFLLQVLFQGQQPTLYAIAGGVLIIVAMIIGNVPCGSREEELFKEDSTFEQNSSTYGSMSQAADSRKR